jgi:hypothetical protein
MLRMSAPSPTNPNRHAFILPDHPSWRNRPAPRPFMQPALEKNKAWIAERLNKAVRIAAAKNVK